MKTLLTIALISAAFTALWLSVCRAASREVPTNRRGNRRAMQRTLALMHWHRTHGDKRISFDNPGRV
jgi:hypothetical protein